MRLSTGVLAGSRIGSFHRTFIELFVSALWVFWERLLAADRNPALFVVAGFPWLFKKGNA